MSKTETLEVSAHDNGRTMVLAVIRKDLQIPTVKHEISPYSQRLSVHTIELILKLQEPPKTSLLPKNLPIDLPARFNM
jgi:hypothetical protein